MKAINSIVFMPKRRISIVQNWKQKASSDVHACSFFNHWSFESNSSDIILHSFNYFVALGCQFIFIHHVLCIVLLFVLSYLALWLPHKGRVSCFNYAYAERKKKKTKKKTLLMKTYTKPCILMHSWTKSDRNNLLWRLKTYKLFKRIFQGVAILNI